MLQFPLLAIHKVGTQCVIANWAGNSPLSVIHSHGRSLPSIKQSETVYYYPILFGFSSSLKCTGIQIEKRIRPNRCAGNGIFLRSACAMKAFFVRQILPPVLVQLSIIVVLVYFEAKDFVPYVSPDEAGADFLAVLVLMPSVLLTWLWQEVVSVRYWLHAPKPRIKAAVLLAAWLAAYPVLLFAAMVLLWQIFLQLFH